MFTERDAERLLREDAPHGDVTARATARGEEAEAEIVAREECVAAGLEEAGKVFEIVGARFERLVEDGDRVRDGEAVAEAEGMDADLLLAERTALNLMMRMSGIATATRDAVERARQVNPDVRVAATRKTAPGLRHLDKRAVELGGGDPHRLDLSHAYLVKENHATIRGLEEAAEAALNSASFAQVVEVEVESVEEALTVAGMGVDALLLDNFSPDEVDRCLDALESELDGDRPLVEVSGGITPETVEDYARRADIVSMGWLTHSAPASDFSMRLSI